MSAVTIVPYPNGESVDKDAPFVDVTVDTPPDGAVTVTVFRTAEGRTYKVRKLVGLSVLSSMSQRDYEAPTDVDLFYSAAFYDADGLPVGFSPTVSTYMESTLVAGAWFHNPLDPSTSVQVAFTSDAVAQMTRSIPSDMLFVRSRSVGVVIGGTRRGLSGLVLDCVTMTTVDTLKFDALFGGYDETVTGVVCVRPGSAMPLPRLLFASIPEPTRNPVSARSGGQATVWNVTGDEAAPPAPALIKALLTLNDFKAFYATLDDFRGAYPNLRTASRDYSVRG